MNRKNIFIWTLYDFANSIVTVVFFLYFSQWLVVDHGVSDFWYNMIFTAGSALLLFTAPVLGSIADKDGRSHRYLNQMTVASFLCFAGASIVTLFFTQKVFLAILLFLMANYFYQFSFVFYNALLRHLASKKDLGKISGVGQAGSWFGQIFGLLITLPLATGAVYLFGAAGRSQTFLPASVLFMLFSLPMLFLFKIKPPEIKVKTSFKAEYGKQWRAFKDLLKDENVKFFFIAYFFFNDAIITASGNFPIFLQNVFGVTDSVKSKILIGILATSVLGALFSGWVTDRIGLKKSLSIVIGSWIILFPILGLVHNFHLFIFCTILMGFLFGSIWTVARTAMTVLVPEEKQNFGFSFYTIAERVSTLVGPLAWGLTTFYFTYLGADRYRIAAASMAIFVAIGLFFVRKIEFSK